MTLQSNKDLVAATWKAFVAGDIKTALANLANDIRWWVPGDLPGISGWKSGKDEVLQFFATTAKLFPNGVQTEIVGSYAEGDKVVLEFINTAKLANGTDYTNEYCYVFQLQNDQIVQVREYFDTSKAKTLM